MLRSEFGNAGRYVTSHRFETVECTVCKKRFDGPLAQRLAEAHVKKAHKEVQ